MSAVWLVVAPGEHNERVVPVADRVHIGRECAGIEPARRVLIEHPEVSRDHAEVRLVGGTAFLTDHSTNGTRLNGRRIERGERIALVDGDVVKIGDVQIALRAEAVEIEPDESVRTVTADSVDDCVILVGDVVGYTRLIEMHGSSVVGATVDGLFRELRRIVAAHLGTVSNFAGDAILAVWEQAAGRDVAAAAVRCALEAYRYCAEATTLAPVRYEDGTPIRLGWAVTGGPLLTSHPSTARVSVHGDAVTLAFRLAGLAGRGEVPPVLVGNTVAELAPDSATYGETFTMQVKGRQSAAQVRAALL